MFIDEYSPNHSFITNKSLQWIITHCVYIIIDAWKWIQVSLLTIFVAKICNHDLTLNICESYFCHVVVSNIPICEFTIICWATTCFTNPKAMIVWVQKCGPFSQKMYIIMSSVVAGKTFKAQIHITEFYWQIVLMKPKKNSCHIQL